MEEREMARDAILVQDACNLSGVVHSFSRVMSRLSHYDLDTREKNGHFLAVLYASKIASLTNCEDTDTFSRAYTMAKELAAIKED